ncbi:HAMP domain-containing protein, partial [Geodermatophilus sp. CPCC 205761]
MDTSTPARRSRIGVRGSILAVGAAGMAAAIAVGGSGLAGLGGAGSTRQEVAALNDALGHSQAMEFFNADVSGWQTAYAWDASRVGALQAVAPDSANRAGFLDVSDRLRDELEAMPREVLTAEEATVYDEIATKWDDFFAVDDQVVALYAQNTPMGKNAADELILGDGYAIYFEIITLTTELKESLQERVVMATDAAAAQETRTRWTMIAIVVAGALLVLGAALAVARRIVRPLDAVVSVARAMAGGDLTRSTGVHRDDEVGRAAAAIDAAVADLRGVLAAVAGSADAVAASSEELSASS